MLSCGAAYGSCDEQKPGNASNTATQAARSATASWAWAFTAGVHLIVLGALFWPRARATARQAFAFAPDGQCGGVPKPPGPPDEATRRARRCHTADIGASDRASRGSGHHSRCPTIRTC